MSGRSGNGIVASALVATLERAWGAIVEHHPQVPEVVVVVAPGSGGRSGELKLGHFAAARWEVDGDQRSELLVGGEGLRLGAGEVLGTPAARVGPRLGRVRGVQDVSRGGRYHNRRYKALAEEVGLAVAQVGSIGWSATTVRDETIARYRSTLAEVEASLVLWRRMEAARPGRFRGAQSAGLRVLVRQAHPSGPGHVGPGSGHLRTVQGAVRCGRRRGRPGTGA